MTVAALTSLPGSRVLLGWWRELSGLQPRRLWFAHLLLHRAEVLVETAVSSPLAGLGQSLLPLLARHPSPFLVDRVAEELHLDRRLLLTVLRELAGAGLVRRAQQNHPDAWEMASATLPPSGNAAVRRERHPFYFVEESPPVFVPLSPQAATPMPPPEGWAFDLAVLEACVKQSAAWKAQHGFPQEVVRIFRLPTSPSEEDWRLVPLTRAEQALLLLVETASGEILGFSVRAEGWALSREPVLSLACGQAWISSLGGDTSDEVWKQSWQAWCQQRSLPLPEVEACRPEQVGHRLLVHAPARLIERLRASRSDAAKGEAWLLAGNGRIRAAALIDLGESEDKAR